MDPRFGPRVLRGDQPKPEKTSAQRALERSQRIRDPVVTHRSIATAGGVGRVRGSVVSCPVGGPSPGEGDVMGVTSWGIMGMFYLKLVGLNYLKLNS